uniref:AP complex mu/sigma subunit domain-containing protein n=1 Tax=Neovison vison TaxID=452646 RepID=A0A8C7EWT6_NEOVI
WVKAIIIFNNHGKSWLSKFYQTDYSEDTEQQIIKEMFHLVSRKGEKFPRRRIVNWRI